MNIARINQLDNTGTAKDAAIILAGKDLTMSDIKQLNNQQNAQIVAVEKARLEHVAVINNSDSILQAGDDLSITDTTRVTNSESGLIYAGNQLNILADEVINTGHGDDTTSYLIGDSKVSITANTLENLDGAGILSLNDNRPGEALGVIELKCSRSGEKRHQRFING